MYTQCIISSLDIILLLIAGMREADFESSNHAYDNIVLYRAMSFCASII